MMWLGRLLWLGLSLFSATAAIAGNQARDWTLGIGSGYIFFDRPHQYHNSIWGSASLGYNFTDQIGIEALVSYAQPKRTTLPYEANTQSLFINGVYRPVLHKTWQPFLLAGVSLVHMVPNGVVTIQNIDGLDPAYAVYFTTGVGLQAFISDNFAFRFDARHAYTTVRHRHDVYLTAGLTYNIHCPGYDPK